MGEKNVARCDRCTPCKLSAVNRQKMSAVLPSQYVHHICQYRDEGDGFWSLIHLPLQTTEEAKQWWKDFQESSLTTMRVDKTFRATGLRNIFKIYLHCQHNVLHRKDRHGNMHKSRKHTECPAYMRIVVKRVVKRSRNLSDPHLPMYPMKVQLLYNHNHELQDHYSLSFRSVDPSTNELIRNLFKVGHSAKTAHAVFRWQRWAEHGPKFEEMALDRAFNPDLDYVYRQFYLALKGDKTPKKSKRKKKKKEKKKGGDTEVESGDEVEAKRRKMEDVERDDATDVDNSVMPEELGDSSVIQEEVVDDSVQQEELAVDSITQEADNSVADVTEVTEDSALDEQLTQAVLAAVQEIKIEEGMNFVGHGLCKRVKGKNRKRVNTIDHQQLYNDLEHFIARQMAETQTPAATMARIGSKDVAVAICTPLMLRAHTMTELSGEVCVLDSLAQSYGQSSCYLVSMMAPSPAGGLPLGFLVLSSLDATVIRQGFELLGSLLPENCFGGRGGQGPALIFTDDASLRPEFLATIFPQSTILISGFHLLQSSWRWMVDPRHKIPTVDRMTLTSIIKDLVSSETPDALDEAHNRILNCPDLIKYPEFFKFISEHILNAHHNWSVAALPSMPQCNARTLWEEAMYTLRDRFSLRGKIYNILQVTHFFLTTGDQCFERNLTQAFSPHQQKASFVPLYLEKYIDSDGIHPINMYEYAVPSKGCGGTHTVNLELGLCSCHVGKSGLLCAHLAAVTKGYHFQWHFKGNFTCLERKFQVHRVATGKKMLEEQFQDVCSKFLQIMETDPDPVREPLQKFVDAFSDVTTGAELAAKLDTACPKVRRANKCVGVTEKCFESAASRLGWVSQDNIGVNGSSSNSRAEQVPTGVRVQPGRRTKSAARDTWLKLEPSSTRPIFSKDTTVATPPPPVIVPGITAPQPLLLQNGNVVIVKPVNPVSVLLKQPTNQSTTFRQIVPAKQTTSSTSIGSGEMSMRNGEPGKDGKGSERLPSVSGAVPKGISKGSGVIEQGMQSSIVTRQKTAVVSQSAVTSVRSDTRQGIQPMNRADIQIQPVTVHSSKDTVPVLAQESEMHKESFTASEVVPSQPNVTSGNQEKLSLKSDPHGTYLTLLELSGSMPSSGSTAQQFVVADTSQATMSQQNVMAERTQSVAVQHSGGESIMLHNSDQAHGSQPVVSQQGSVAESSQAIALQHSRVTVAEQPVTLHEGSMIYSQQAVVPQQTTSGSGDGGYPTTVHVVAAADSSHPSSTQEKSAEPFLPPIVYHIVGEGSEAVEIVESHVPQPCQQVEVQLENVAVLNQPMASQRDNEYGYE